MCVKAVYPGSFDPITYGHIDIIERGINLFDKVVVAILINPKKQPLFTVEERLEMIRESLKTFPQEKIEISSFSGLLVDYVKKINAKAILRGIRAISDFEYEFQMALTNRRLLKDVDTVFMMPDERYSYLSANLVREIALFGGDVSHFVPEHVAEKLKEKFK
ncbi:pantetheine-phosphate adenylyltransferase [Thermotomaculum hydrothermale]|uniref:Phosphopantetheine adenylyltransferase n=1 Tax=Thermotomaculum hydrothermale TaxID=981385 RepID=A0A7R6T0C7_9BACT|nr:pantetheine-phosphate adenylyltransferase [Thermotomaculum hydrothermale]BBB33572.1 pantetheine-phosphate adenylyltransferase [Thermotomaculum hydrothermale]